MDFFKDLSQAKKITIAGGIVALVLVVGIYLLIREGTEERLVEEEITKEREISEDVRNFLEKFPEDEREEILELYTVPSGGGGGMTDEERENLRELYKTPN